MQSKKCPKKHRIVPFVWRPSCLFRLLCNKMDTLNWTHSSAVQHFNLFHFCFVSSFQVRSPCATHRKNICSGNQRLGRMGKAPFWQLIYTSGLQQWVMHYRPFHHGPCCSHEAFYFSQASLLMARRAQGLSPGGHQAPLPLLDGHQATQCDPVRAQPVPLFLLLFVSFQTHLCEISQ